MNTQQILVIVIIVAALISAVLVSFLVTTSTTTLLLLPPNTKKAPTTIFQEPNNNNNNKIQDRRGDAQLVLVTTVCRVEESLNPKKPVVQALSEAVFRLNYAWAESFHEHNNIDLYGSYRLFDVLPIALYPSHIR